MVTVMYYHIMLEQVEHSSQKLMQDKCEIDKTVMHLAAQRSRMGPLVRHCAPSCTEVKNGSTGMTLCT